MLEIIGAVVLAVISAVVVCTCLGVVVEQWALNEFDKHNR